MITRISIAFTFLCCSAIWAADIFQSLNLKPGLWETTRTTEMSGQLPREAMAKMPPEQRAKAEEMMKEYAKMFAKPVVSRDCMKKEDFDRPFKLDNLEKSCTKTVLSATSSKQEMRLQCTDGGVKQISWRLPEWRQRKTCGPVQRERRTEANTAGSTLLGRPTVDGLIAYS